MSMRERYTDLRKLAEMTDEEWDHLADEELLEILDLVGTINLRSNDSISRVPMEDPRRPKISRK